MSSDTVKQFEGFTNYILEKYRDIKYNKLVDFDYLTKIVLDICGKALIISINEKRINKKLKGETPEKRYRYFDEKLCKSGIIYKEISQKYPSIIKDLENTINSYFILLEEIVKKFEKDKKKLFQNRLIKDKSETIIHIDILGDLHGGKAVTKVITNKSNLLYKPRSLTNDQFFLSFLKLMKSLEENEITEYYNYKFINYKDYGWVEYIEKKPTSKDKINVYYKRIGYLLALGYILNISDLHFENILCSNNFPILVDLETMFHTSIYKPNFCNLATQNIEEKSGVSVFATGMLPISRKDKNYGGDISGILGGSFNKEKRIIDNPNRDDIQFKKKLIRIKKNGHIPFYIENNKEYRYSPEDYIENIEEGFIFGYSLFLNNKEEILEYIKNNSLGVTVRILARSTIEYSVLIQAAKSPIYANKRNELFNKLERFGRDLLSDELIKSEIKQINTLSVPYFYTKVHSNVVQDINDEKVHDLSKSPFNMFLEKSSNYSMNDLRFQSKLINFSLESQKKLFVDGKDFISYKYDENSPNNINDAIEDLVNIIINNAVIDNKDSSINWMNLGISKEEEIIFESLSDDLYKGLSGIGISLMKYYKINKKFKNISKVKKILDTIYSSILNNIENNSNREKDLSFFNGEIGKVAFMNKYEREFKDNCEKSKSYMKEILQLVTLNDFALNDIIAGLPGIISYLYNQKIFLNEIMIMGEKLLKNIDSRPIMASYAHGESGLMVSFLYLYDLTKDKRYLTEFYKEWEKESTLKLNRGWKDIRQKNSTYSVSWCNGVTGQLISRLIAVEINNKLKIFDNTNKELLDREIKELLNLLIEDGLEQDNFCLCHGSLGNLLVLNYYQKMYEINNKKLEKNIEKNFYSITNFGLNKGWICGLGNHFYSFGIMTGVSGILYALLKYKNNENDLGILLPNI